MPRKKRTSTVIEEVLPDEKNTETGKDEITDYVIVLSKVYKINQVAKAFAFQTEAPVDEVGIQDRYPTGGKFLVLEFNANGEQVNSDTFDIEAKPYSPNT